MGRVALTSRSGSTLDPGTRPENSLSFGLTYTPPSQRLNPTRTHLSKCFFPLSQVVTEVFPKSYICLVKRERGP